LIHLDRFRDYILHFIRRFALPISYNLSVLEGLRVIPPLILARLLAPAKHSGQSFVRMFCVKCNKEAKSFCGRCKSVAYCSVACQRADWPAHKAACQCKIVVNGIAVTFTASFGKRLIRSNENDTASIEIVCSPRGSSHVTTTYPRDNAFIYGLLT
jgi:hypothetical protein